MDFGKVIRLIRAARGISQRELSKMTGIDYSHVSRIEAGKRVPSLKALEKIAKSLDVPMDVLVLLSTEKKGFKGVDRKNIEKVSKILVEILMSNKTAHK